MFAPREIIDLTDATDCEIEDMTCDGLFPPPVDGASEYRVERILEVRGRIRGQRQFLVKWFGYPYDDCTCEPENSLSNCSSACAMKQSHILGKKAKNSYSVK